MILGKEVGSRFDLVKLVLVFVLVALGFLGFYVYAEYSLLYRVLGLLLAVVIAAVIGLQTERGRQILQYFQEAQLEVRKVVWPTREESFQTTLIVIVVVILMAIILWLLDLFLGWAIGSLIG